MQIINHKKLLTRLHFTIYVMFSAQCFETDSTPTFTKKEDLHGVTFGTD